MQSDPSDNESGLRAEPEASAVPDDAEMPDSKPAIDSLADGVQSSKRRRKKERQKQKKLLGHEESYRAAWKAAVEQVAEDVMLDLSAANLPAD